VSADAYRFVALVPHASARAELKRWTCKAFAAGGTGFCSGPAVAPVALLDAPASRTDLKQLAGFFRLQSFKSGGDGRISAGQISQVRLPDGKTLAGFRLSIEPPPLPAGMAIVESFPELILCAGIFSGAPELSPLETPLRFSAAALANMVLRPLGCEQSYEWTIGEGQWLPSTRRGVRS
jgi:hypothetical protein